MKSILVFRSAALGDFIMSVPAFVELKKIYPNHNIVLVTTQSFDKSTKDKVYAYAGDEVPWVSLVVPHLINEIVVIKSLSSLSDFKKIRNELCKFHFSAGIIMVDPCAPWLGRLKKLFLLFLLVPGLKFYGWRGKGSLSHTPHHQLKKLGLLRHHVHGPLQFMSELRPKQIYKDDELCFDLKPGLAAEGWAYDWLNKNNLFGRRIIAIAPGSIQPHKKWPLNSFKVLLSRLLVEYQDIYVLIIGSRNDYDLGQDLCLLDQSRVFNLAGESSITQSAALLKYVTLMVGNDGGAMHLADALGCRVISIVPGIEYPDSIEPWHNKDLVVRWPVDCSPCYSFSDCPRGHMGCMLNLPVELVLGQCEKILTK